MNEIPKLLFGAIALGLSLIMTPFLVESNTSGQILVITSPSGHISVYTDPGLHFQGFGSTAHYNKRGQFKFDNSEGQDNTVNIRFNDSGTAKLSGVLNYELSSDPTKLTDMHAQYQSAESVQSSLIGTALQRSVFATGSLMSSTESYSSRRTDLFSLIGDQIRQGIFATTGETRTENDQGVEKLVTRVSVKTDSKSGQPLITEKSVLERYGIILQTISLSNIEYDEKVKKNIDAQLDATIKVQTAIAEAKKSEQDVKTAMSKGLADKAEAEAKANVVKATAVIEADREKEVALTKAGQQKEVAQLALDTAKLESEAVIAKGKGEAEARKLSLEADNGLKQKLEAYTVTQTAWANAFKEIKVPVVPGVIMGGAGGTNTGSLENVMQLISAKAAKDLGVDLTIPDKK